MKINLDTIKETTNVSLGEHSFSQSTQPSLVLQMKSF